ncbi:MAG: ABC transporter permease subunit [Actinomycetales bacterium]|nr:ABC transporter permease subunit [Actinomycetales bacterium]
MNVKAALSLRWVQVLIVLVGWFVLATLLKGVQTQELSMSKDTAFTAVLREFASAIRGNRTESFLFVYFFNPIRAFISGFIELIMGVISMPAEGNLIPLIGWFGTLVLIGFIVYATSNLRTALFSMFMLLVCGMLGMWLITLDTLAMTIGAVVLSLAIALPLGVWAGVNDRVMAILRPWLDLAQVLPTLVYLAPLALVFLIGIASATIATMIYSIPICIRITAHAIKSLKRGPLEAAESAGSTRWQVLTKVQLPMAKRTIILAINQTTLAALSFVVIAALIGAPGLGEPVVQALTIRNVGDGVVAGLAVVFLAIMLDRSTTAAVMREEQGFAAADAQKARRRIGLIIGAVVTLVAIYLSRYLLWFAIFPEQLNFGEQVAAVANSLEEWVTSNLDFLTVGFSEWFTIWALNPLEGVLANSPWWLTIVAITLLAFILAGRTVGILVFVLLALIMATGLWNATMVTLAMTLIATAFVVLIGIVLGVWAGRSERVDRIFKPFLDAGQTMPAFVYLVPVLALFGPTRFAAIVLGIVYAAPVVIRIVADGVRKVPKETVEAAISSGSTTMQVITKVQLPTSRRSILLGANQGLIFVLAVVVIGGFVGAGGLGYLVIVGQSKPELAGKGLAAGIAIVLLGIILDRIAQGRPRKQAPQGH